MDHKKAALIGIPDNKQRKAMMGDFVPEDVHSYRINRHSFTVYVGSDPNIQQEHEGIVEENGVDHNMADRFEMNLGILSGISMTRPILVQMSTCGGYWDEGMQMAGAIATCPNPVTVLGTKWCRSMSSIIPLFADRFVIRPPAPYMIHRGTYAYSGIDQEVETADVERRKTQETMLRLYVARLREQGAFQNWPERRIRAMIEESYKDHIDFWLDSDEAVRWGFVDAVYTGDQKTLRATKKNAQRRELMLDVLRRPVKVDIKVS